MSNWWILGLIAWTAFWYFLGRSDGNNDVQEKQLLEDFDRVIEKVRRRLGVDTEDNCEKLKDEEQKR